MNVLLDVKELTKKYEDNGIAALDNVSFQVYEGEFLSILGPSGCGKTTILRILIGLLEPTSGTILMDGKDITHALPSERNMGIVFQNYALFENMTVLQNVEYAMKIHKETRGEAKSRALYIIEKMGLQEQCNKRPGELSGGQQQRVAIARTLVLNPKIILFDEPMSALDAATRLSLRQEIKNIQKEYHSTMIYITHDQEEAFSMSDRVMVMETSHVVQIDTPEKIIKHPANKYIEDFVINNLKIKIDSLMRFVDIRQDNEA